jgi:hypothetical protein
MLDGRRFIMDLEKLLKDLDNELTTEGYYIRGSQDGTGPNKDSAMAAMGRTGPKSGRKMGNCPDREDFDSDEEYEKAVKKWKKEMEED